MVIRIINTSTSIAHIIYIEKTQSISPHPAAERPGPLHYKLFVDNNLCSKSNWCGSSVAHLVADRWSDWSACCAQIWTHWQCFVWSSFWSGQSDWTLPRSCSFRCRRRASRGSTNRNSTATAPKRDWAPVCGWVCVCGWVWVGVKVGWGVYVCAKKNHICNTFYRHLNHSEWMQIIRPLQRISLSLCCDLTTRLPMTTVARKNGMHDTSPTSIQSHIDSIHSPHSTRNTIMKECMKSVKFQRGKSPSGKRSTLSAFCIWGAWVLGIDSTLVTNEIDAKTLWATRKERKTKCRIRKTRNQLNWKQTQDATYWEYRSIGVE